MSGDMNFKSKFVSYVLADVTIFVQKVPFIFWHYVDVDKVSRITLKKIITKRDGINANNFEDRYYKV